MKITHGGSGQADGMETTRQLTAVKRRWNLQRIGTSPRGLVIALRRLM